MNAIIASSRSFEIAIHESHGGCTVIAVSGEVDMTAVPSLQKAFGSVDAIDRVVLLDLRRVTFIDSSGLEPIMEAEARSREGSSRIVIEPSASVSRLLDVAGVRGSLDVLGEQLAPELLSRSAGAAGTHAARTITAPMDAQFWVRSSRSAWGWARPGYGPTLR